MMLRWQKMAATDLVFVERLGCALYPNHPESLAAFETKFRATEDACLIARDRADNPVGYCIAVRAELGHPPHLDDTRGPPRSADCLHLHDLALAPPARGQGLVAAAIAHLESAAHGLPLTLIAVNGTRALWQRYGFADALCAYDLAADYGMDARYMRR
jgi:GNAT superfamily N-acetyltransferase